MSSYNPLDWYWIVVGSTTQVWTSKRVGYVPTSDATYVAWLGVGNIPTVIDSATTLADVIISQWVPVQLSAGVQINSSSTPTLNSIYGMSQNALNNITGVATSIASARGLPGGGATFNWIDAAGVPRVFNSANFQNFAVAVEGYVYALNQSVVGLVLGVPGAALPALPLAIA